jgi:hypothetical protein
MEVIAEVWVVGDVRHVKDDDYVRVLVFGRILVLLRRSIKIQEKKNDFSVLGRWKHGTKWAAVKKKKKK